MSITLKITNKYAGDIQAYDTGHTLIKEGESKTLGGTFQDTKLDVWGLGSINILDIGKKIISGYSKKTLGYLISYQGSELEYRFEGQGHLDLTFNVFGQCIPKADGDLVLVRLPSFDLDNNEDSSPMEV